MKTNPHCTRPLLTAALLFAATIPSQAANLTWTNTGDGLWSEPANWSPNQVPGAPDIVRLTNHGTYVVTLDVDATVNRLILGTSSGLVTLTNPGHTLTLTNASVFGTNGVFRQGGGSLAASGLVTVRGEFDWQAGTLSGSLVVETNGTLNLPAEGVNRWLGGALTNRGTVNWLGGFVGIDPWNYGDAAGPMVNEAGGLWDIQCDQLLGMQGTGTNACFQNAGTVRKSAATGTTTISVPFYNTGTVEALQGTLSFNNGGSIEGSFSAAGGTAITFSGGSFSNRAPAALTGAGLIQFTGGSLSLWNDQVSNLALTGGTLSLEPGFQGGTITNLTLGGSTLTGSNLVGGVLNWAAGKVAGSLTVETNGTLNLPAEGVNRWLGGALTNRGTVNWLGGFVGIDPWNYGDAAGPMVNEAGGLWDIQCDQLLGMQGTGINACFQNAGTVRKSAATGTTTISVPFHNTGTVEALQGTLSFNNGGSIEGTFGAAGGTAITFSGGSFSNSAPATLTGAGAIQFTGGSLSLWNDQVSNLALAGGTLGLEPGFQGGTITNLTLGGSTLTGSNLVAGVLNWVAGKVAGSLTVETNGTLNLPAEGVNRWLGGALTNRGTVNWLGGFVGIDPWNYGDAAGPMVNEAGGLWDIQCDQLLGMQGTGINACFQNAGTVRKSAATGTTTISVPFHNTGTVEALQGTLSFNNGGSIEGSFSAAGGTAITFSGGSFSNSAPAALTGAGLIQFTGGSLSLWNDQVSNLALTGGTLSLEPGFQGGTITNLTLGGSTLTGSNLVGGVLNWAAGKVAGSLTVETNGTLNLPAEGVNRWLGGALTNRGTVNWLGGFVGIDPWNYGDAAGPMVNEAGGLWDIQCDQLLGMQGTGINACFQNAGTVRKSAAAGTTTISVPFNNSGMVEAQIGTIQFAGGCSNAPSANLAIVLSGAMPGSGYGQIQFTSPVTFDGAFSVSTNHGYRPNPGETFTVMTYPSRTGGFTSMSGLNLGEGLVLQPQFTFNNLILTAGLAPTIANQPQSQTVTNGNLASFSVIAGGTEPLAYLWQKNEMDLADRDDISGATSNRLTLSLTTPADAGDYQVIVTNAYGATPSEVARLTFVLQGFALPISSGSHTQTFDTLAASPSGDTRWLDGVTLPGWYSARTSPTLGPTIRYRVNDGRTNIGGLYSFGLTDSPERALGSITSDIAGNHTYGARFTNDTPLTVSNVLVSFTGEQWHDSGTGQTQSLAFSYLVSSSPITNADAFNANPGWVRVAALDFANPSAGITASALDGNQSTNRQVFSYVPLPGVHVTPGQELFLRWYDTNAAGYFDHGLAIDDVGVAFGAPPLTSNATVTVSIAPVSERWGIVDQGVLQPAGSFLQLGSAFFSFQAPEVGEYRMAMEFGLSSFDAAATNWILQITPAESFGRTRFFAYGYPGDGTVEVADLSRNDSLVINQSGSPDGIPPYASGSAMAFDVTSFVQSAITNGVNLLGFAFWPSQVTANNPALYTKIASSMNEHVDWRPALIGQIPVSGAAILNQPQSLTVTNGSPASFTVTAGGTKPLVFQWRKGATNLVDNAFISGATSSVLSFSTTTPADAGDYRAIVTNSYGSATSTVATLTVLTTNSSQPGVWVYKTPMSVRRSGASALEVGGLIYLVGGANENGLVTTVEAYNPVADSWTTKAPLPTGRVDAAAGAINGLIYFAGGYTGSGFSSALEIYNPALDAWTNGAAMLDPVEAPGLSFNGVLYAFGGNYHGNVKDYVQAYDASSNRWQWVAPMPTGRMSEGVAVADGKIYTIGGNQHTGTPVGAVEVYDPISNTWSFAPSLPTTRRWLAAAAANGLIYAVGGVNYSNGAYQAVATVEIYDPAVGRWTPGSPMLTNRIGVAVCAVNNTLFAFGGMPDATAGETLSSVEALVLLPAAPTLHAALQADDTLLLTWNTELGRVYQLQYKTNLWQPNWIDLAGGCTATNVSMSRTDLISGTSPRLYRVRVGP